MMTDLAPIKGLTRWIAGAAALGVVGLGLTGLAATSNLKEAAFGYLFAFVYWLTFSLGALFTLTIFHASHARWPIVFRRPLEWMAMTSVIFIPLFVPVIFLASVLFIWVHPPAALGAESLRLLAHKHAWLNVDFFLFRAAGYFVIWGLVAGLLYHWSKQQDSGGDPRLVGWQWKLSAGALPFVAVATSFAALDWVMSLEPLWTSTLFGVYLFSGAMVTTLSTLACAAAFLRGPASFGQAVTPAHFNRLGSLLLGFVCFWAYCAYSQGMLIWIAGRPVESEWLLARTHAGWGWLAWGLIVGHFAVPFLLLLFRSVKQHRHRLALVAVGLALGHAADVYWCVLPALHPDTVHFHWASLTAFLGVGGVSAAFTLWLASGRFAMPIKDPYLINSLEVPLS